MGVWDKPLDKEAEKRDSVRRKSRTSLAELTLPESELRRLRNLALRTKNKKRVGGVTREMVELIHHKWKLSEIVRLKIEVAPALNMKRMHEILEVSFFLNPLRLYFSICLFSFGCS